MTATELRAILHLSHLAQNEAAEMLGVHPSTLKRWISKDEAQRIDIPAPVAKLMKLMSLELITHQQIKAMKG